MIIKFPTGFYSNVLKTSGNVTFTISNTDPPRTDLLYSKIVAGVADQDVPVLDFARDDVGDLVYSVSGGSSSEPSAGNKQFQTGDILDFTDINLKQVDSMLVSDISEVRHDTYRYDPDRLGIDDSEAAAAYSKAATVYNDIVEQLNTIKVKRRDAEVEIANYQKSINDINRNIDALEIVHNNTGDDDILAIINKLKSNRDDLQTKLDKAIDDANNYATEASKLNDQLRVVASIVK